MTTCIAATDALAIAAWSSVAVAQFDWDMTVEAIKAQSLVQVYLGLMSSILCVALVPGWFAGQLYTAVKILQQLISDDSLGIGSGVKWDSVFSAVLLIASLAQLIVTFPTIATLSDERYQASPYTDQRYQASDGRNGALQTAYVVVVGYGTLIFVSSASLCAFGAGILFLTSKARQPVRFFHPLVTFKEKRTMCSYWSEVQTFPSGLA